MKNDFKFIKHVNFIKNIYAIQCVFILLSLLVVVGGQSEFLEKYSIAEFLVTLSISASIFYGIKASKSWVVILILLFSYWGIFESILKFLEQDGDIVEIVVNKTVATIGFIFQIYKIAIFSKAETKKYFKERGVTLVT